MAVFRIEIKNHGRGIISRIAYRFGEKFHDNHFDKTFDYRDKEFIDDKFHVVPKGSPKWAHDVEEFWNKTEAAERQHNARVGREFLVTLPRELDSVQQRELVSEFVQQEFTERGLVASVATHSPLASDGLKNGHSHIIVCPKPITSAGFASRKDRTFDNRQGVRDIRKSWELHVNQSLELSGSTERVSADSLAKQKRLKLEQGDLYGALAKNYTPEQPLRGSIRNTSINPSVVMARAKKSALKSSVSSLRTMNVTPKHLRMAKELLGLQKQVQKLKPSGPLATLKQQMSKLNKATAKVSKKQAKKEEKPEEETLPQLRLEQ